jgi:hypothetical protein
MTGVDAIAVEQEMAECPDCCGNGVIFVERLFGRNAPEPYRTKTCGACGGTGEVSAEWVSECAQPGCGMGFWRGAGCEHDQESPLCPDHKNPSCPECLDELEDRRAEQVYDAWREDSLIGGDR